MAEPHHNASRGNRDAPRFRHFIYGVYRRYTGLSNALRRRLTPAGWLVLGLLVVSAAVGLDTRQTTAYQVFTLIASLLAVSILLGLCFRPTLRVSRSCPRFGSVGDRLTYHVAVQNLRKRPCRSLSLREEFGRVIPAKAAFLFDAEPGESERNRFDRLFLFYRWSWLSHRLQKAEEPESPTFSLPPGGRQQVALELEPLRRGALRLGSMVVQKADPFGLVKSQRRAAADRAGTITVLPKRYRLPPIELPGRSQYQPRGVALAGSVGQSEEILGLRDYRPGDPLRHIHWKSWARLNKPIVMEFEDEFFPRYALALDTFAEYDHGGVFEEAVSVAASFVCTLDTKDSLLDLMFVGTEAFCFTSGRNTSEPERLLEVLASVELCQAHSFQSLDGLILAHLKQLSACVCVFIDWDDARRQCVQRLRANGLELLVLVILPDDVPPPEDPGAAQIHFLHVSTIQEELARL